MEESIACLNTFSLVQVNFSKVTFRQFYYVVHYAVQKNKKKISTRAEAEGNPNSKKE